MKNDISLALVILVLTSLFNCTGENENSTTLIFEEDDSILIEDDSSPPVSERYISEVFDDFKVTTDIQFASVTTNDGQSINLTLDFYEPENDTETLRPLLAFAHGGGLIRGDKEEGVFLAPLFCKSGYTIASLNYRLADSESSSSEMLTGLIDAVNDMKSAVRYMKENHKQYGIDSTKIFIGGTSAGAFLALHYGYVESGTEYQEAVNDEAALYFEQTGGLEGNSGNGGSAFPVLGVFNFAGALASAEMLDPNESPIFSAHGTDDDTVPYESGEADTSGILTEGSKLIHDRAEEVGVLNELITIQNGTHDVVGECEDCLTKLRSFIYDLL